MRKFVVLALVFGALGFTAVGASQNVKAFKGSGGVRAAWVKAYNGTPVAWVKAYPGPTSY